MALELGAREEQLDLRLTRLAVWPTGADLLAVWATPPIAGLTEAGSRRRGSARLEAGLAW